MTNVKESVASSVGRTGVSSLSLPSAETSASMPPIYLGIAAHGGVTTPMSLFSRRFAVVECSILLIIGIAVLSILADRDFYTKCIPSLQLLTTWIFKIRSFHIHLLKTVRVVRQDVIPVEQKALTRNKSSGYL